MPTNTYTRLARAASGTRCDRCQTLREVAALTVIHETSGQSADGTTATMNLCTICLAEAIGKVIAPTHSIVFQEWWDTHDRDKYAYLAEE